jgi:hypothetical protein
MEPEAISAIANVVSACATLLAVSVAGAGLNLWRQELVGKDEYLVARDLIRASAAVHIWIHKLCVSYDYPGVVSLQDVEKKLIAITDRLEFCDCICDAVLGDVHLEGPKQLHSIATKVPAEIREHRMNREAADRYLVEVRKWYEVTLSELRPFVRKNLSAFASPYDMHT